ncbi:Ktr4p [Sugiyamaella lignohabitans]|uniref:Ktr4p n=1 Tax=Sugiyamaella lignohabitans TaxID=796027 RepID=A0A167EB94_9ASCO|nr:Ktr4p [Sugiyamaella lignohabitans]ANB13863.1 Ktr4p [Sugiyamaella lignohabitans]
MLVRYLRRPIAIIGLFSVVVLLAMSSYLFDLDLTPYYDRKAYGQKVAQGDFIPDKQVDLSKGYSAEDPSRNEDAKNPLFDEKLEPDGGLSRLTETDKRVPATLMSLVRNKEADDLMATIVQIESAFNNKFNYPWTFFNDEEFTEDFKTSALAATGGNCTFVKIEPEDWMEPSWIDVDKARELGIKMKNKDDVQYADLPSYHRMCRWNSGRFFMNPALDNYDYYWRVEPKTDFYCDIDYDIFAYMKENDKVYGFVINLYDSPQSIRTLWPTTKEFFEQNPEYLHPNNALQWVVNTGREGHTKKANGYSTCHFWSNFEIGSLEFFRSKPYQDYFDFLDKNGGFFYERWGDAPVHSLGLAMMADKSKIHYFKDIGYQHFPYFNCPASPKCKGCDAGKFTGIDSLNTESCMSEWFKAAGTG